MSGDPVTRIAHLRIVKLSADLEAELRGVAGAAPSLEILMRLRDRAAESLAALAFLNVHDPKDRLKIVTLQNEVKRYDEWVGWLREIISEGITYDREITAQDREEMLDLLTQSAEGQRQAVDLGLLDLNASDD